MAYTDFIPQNVAPLGIRRIGIYDANGNRVGQIPLGSLTPPTTGQKQYSFGALSDVHIVYQTAETDFQKALTYLNENVDVAFTCICGDLTDNGTAEQLAQYKAVVDEYSPDTPVYAIAGNHEGYDGNPVTTEKIKPYTGQPLYYSFTHGNDVFIMVGEYRWNANYLLSNEELQWLYETLEANRNKRCFVFFHVFPWGDSGNANGIYTSNIFTGKPGSVFQSLMQHYKNVTLFHGHSHIKFYMQKKDPKANYSDALGFRSVHIPSLAVPRDDANGDGTYENVYADSEGYVVDVYSDGIHLRGRDFVKGEFLPIASYWLDTTLQTIPAGTYTDPTGTITT
jgi:predicted phosphodiesterase